MKTNTNRLLAGAAFAGALLCSYSAEASVQMTFTWNGSYYQSGFSGGLVTSSEAIGIYKFTTSGNGISNPFYSVCLSPAGRLDGGTHNYDILSFSEANPGIFPSSWAWGVVDNKPQYWGINNAAWLWNQYGMAIVNNTGGIGQQNERAAALEFAIWTALYNSTGYGALGGSTWTQPTLTGNTLSWYNTYVQALDNSGPSGAIYTGDILRGVNYTQSGQQQEFLMLGTPIPEPTTLFAGALLLIPLGIASLRISRRRTDR